MDGISISFLSTLSLEVIIVQGQTPLSALPTVLGLVVLGVTIVSVETRNLPTRPKRQVLQRPRIETRQIRLFSVTVKEAVVTIRPYRSDRNENETLVACRGRPFLPSTVNGRVSTTRISGF